MTLRAISRRAFLRHAGAGLVTLAPSRALAQDRHVSIVIDGLECAKTTEPGDDEIYILAIGRHHDGSRRWGDRRPADGSYWRMSPDPRLRRIANKELSSFQLAPGHSVSLAFMILEEDGGNALTGPAAAAAIAAKIDDPYTAAAGGLFAALTSAGVFPGDPDDYVGSFGAHVTNEGGVVSVRWRAIDRVYRARPLTNGNEIAMNGSGSNYTCRVRWQ